jgi:hypothetical protein
MFVTTRKEVTHCTATINLMHVEIASILVLYGQSLKCRLEG